METILEKRAGNIILRIEKDEELEYLVVKTAIGHFEMRIRKEVPMFAVMKELMENDEEGLYGAVAHLWFSIGITIPDGEYIEDLVNALEGVEKRFLEGYNPEEEDDEKVLEDMEAADALKEQIEADSEAE